MLKLKHLAKALFLFAIYYSSHSLYGNAEKYQIIISGSPILPPSFEITNKSTANYEIDSIEFEIQKLAYQWMDNSFILEPTTGPSATCVIVNDGTSSAKKAIIDFNNFQKGDTVNFRIGVKNITNPNSIVDYRQALISNTQNDAVKVKIDYKDINNTIVATNSFYLTGSTGSSNDYIVDFTNPNDANGFRKSQVKKWPMPTYSQVPDMHGQASGGWFEYGGLNNTNHKSGIHDGKLFMTDEHGWTRPRHGSRPHGQASSFTINSNAVPDSSRGFGLSFSYMLRNGAGAPGGTFGVHYTDAPPLTLGIPPISNMEGINVSDQSSNALSGMVVIRESDSHYEVNKRVNGVSQNLRSENGRSFTSANETLTGRVNMSWTPGPIIAKPYAYWNFDDQAKNQIAALTQGNSYDLNLNGDPSYNDSLTGFNKAITLNGGNDYLSSNLDLRIMSDLTISAWVNIPNTVNNPVKLFGQKGVVEVGMEFDQGKRKITAEHVNAQGNKQVLFVYADNLSGWTHIVFSRELNNDSIYINGVRKNKRSTNGFSASSSYTFEIGNSSANAQDYFIGSIDDLAVWNEALKGEEINKLYTKELRPNSDGRNGVLDFFTTGLSQNPNFTQVPTENFIGSDQYNFIIAANTRYESHAGLPHPHIFRRDEGHGSDQRFAIDKIKISTSNPKYEFNGPLYDLTIKSELVANTASNTSSVPAVDLFVNGQLFKPNIGTRETFSIPSGAYVEIYAPQFAYFGYDRNGNEIRITDSSDISRDAKIRYESSAIRTANNPTQYQYYYAFTMDFSSSIDGDITVLWEKDVALDIDNDIETAKSDLLFNSNHFSHVTNTTSGNPNPPHGKNWFRVGDPVDFQIDKIFQDTNRLSQKVRYVARSYSLTNKNNEMVSADGSVVQAPIVISNPGAAVQGRYQVPSITMSEPLTLKVNWGLQYGIDQHAILDDSTNSDYIPIVIDSQGNKVNSNNSIYWGDEGQSYFIGAERVFNASNRYHQLRGWRMGDGFYFRSTGYVTANFQSPTSVPNTSSYTLYPSGTSVAAPVWESSRNNNGSEYSGYQISSLQHPVKVTWQYGRPIISVDVNVGDYVFQRHQTQYANDFKDMPTSFSLQGDLFTEPTQAVNDVSTNDLSIDRLFKWDANNKKLYAVWSKNIENLQPSDNQFPEKVVDVLWQDINGVEYVVQVTIKWPQDSNQQLDYHYPHLVRAPPVSLDPDPDDEFKFLELIHTTAGATIDSQNGFTADQEGVSVLLFSEHSTSITGTQSENYKVRIVRTSQTTTASSIDTYIGEKISAPSLDLAVLGTGYLIQNTITGLGYSEQITGDLRVNIDLYDQSKWSGINPKDIYEDPKTELTLKSNYSTTSPGPIFPVNLNKNSSSEIIVGWFDNPNNNDGLLWPHQVTKYTPKWRKESDFTAYDPNIPQPFGKNLKRIVIASQYGSESKDSSGDDQTVVDLDVQNPTTFDPSRFQELKIYNQPDINMPGYNPNEEHAFLAPSLRYADVSPRPDAVYALRNGDLNRFTATDINSVSNGHTSVPRVLVSFYDLEKRSYQMQVYEIKKQADENESWPDVKSHKFATIPSTPTAQTLDAQSHIEMKAGEPVIPFYPLGVAIGAAPLKETFGGGIPIGGNTQSTYWEDHRGSYWAISGGDNAWFKVSFYYPLLPDFWWPDGVVTKKLNAPTTEGGNPTIDIDAVDQVPSIGDALSFLPNDYDNNTQADEIKPTEILYKSDWPDTAPTLKAGETLTFSGGEYRSDNPTQLTTNSDGEVVRVNTEGLPGVVGFASAEVIFDSLNPSKSNLGWRNDNTWTARVIQPLEVRKVNLSTNDYPSSLEPSRGKTMVKGGKYIFKELTASLQKRVRYDPLAEKLELIGLLNDKDIGDSTLTAAPPAVYALEPNILTKNDRYELKSLDGTDDSNWDKTIDRLYWLSRNPGTDGLDDAPSSSASPGKGTGRISASIGGKALENDDYYVGLQGKVRRDSSADASVVSFGITGEQDSYTAAVQNRTDLYDFTTNDSKRVADDEWRLSVGDQSAVYRVATDDEAISVVVAGLVSDWGGAGATKGDYTITSSSGNTITVQRSGSADASVVLFGITGSQDSYKAAAQNRTDLYDFTTNDSKRVADDEWRLSVGDQSAVYRVATDDEEISVVVAGLVSNWGGKVTKGDYKITDFSGNTITVQRSGTGGLDIAERLNNLSVPLVGLGPGLAIVPNANFLDPSNTTLPDISWITIVENNHESLGDLPVTPHIIKVDRRQRYRGSIQTLLSSNVFDENINLQHTGEFGANADDLVFEWWYRIDDGSQNVPPPNLLSSGTPNPWKLYPDQNGKGGLGRFKITLEGTPNAPEALLADTFWFCRYRHKKEIPENSLFWKPYGVDTNDDGSRDDSRLGAINFDWAGAGNSQPLVDADFDGFPDYRAQFVMGWIKRVMDTINPYEARIKEFDSDVPSTVVSMLAQLGQRYEGPVALNPDKNVIENVGLIELYRTILERAKSLTIDLSRPISSPAIAKALQLASSRLGDFYTLLGNEAYADALDPTIGFGSDSVDAGSFTSGVHAFQNQTSSLLEEELALLRGVDDYYARPVYNRLFWNFTKAEGEAAYAMNYNLSDVNMDGFINEDDAMLSYPQGHGDAWGHYLSAMRHTYELLANPAFNWVSRSESYNLQDVVIGVDFFDERKFASTAAAKAKAGKEIVESTYRSKYIEDPAAQWQGYKDDNEDRAWGVEGWAKRAAQGAYFDWVTANALLPAVHPNKNLEGIQKVDRASNSDIKVISANHNAILSTMDTVNKGYNPLGVPNGDSVVMDFDPTITDAASDIRLQMHFDQMYKRAEAAIENAQSVWERANEPRNMIRQVNNTEAEFRNSAFQEDLSYKNQLIQIFGKPYEGTIGSGKFYPAGYDGPDLALYMYADQSVREISHNTVPLPTTSFAKFDGPNLSGGSIFEVFRGGFEGRSMRNLPNSMLQKFAPTFASNNGTASFQAKDNYWNVNYTDMTAPKVPLDGLANAMPVKAGGYTFQAPQEWGKRLVAGELQMIIIQMIQKEAEVAEAIAEWDALTGEIFRQFNVVNSRLFTGSSKRTNTIAMAAARRTWDTIVAGIETARKVIQETGKTLEVVGATTAEAIPQILPTVGFSVSPGDAFSLARAGAKISTRAPQRVLSGVEQGLEIGLLVGEQAISWSEFGIDLANDDLDRNQGKRESIKELEDLVGDESIKRVSVFKELQALKELGDRYVSKLDEGGRLVDEREHFNKQVAASVQRERYQDMNFRIARNHALRNYKDSLNLAAKYAYMAGKAYEFETNLPTNHEGSVIPLLNDIVKSRGLGPLNKALSKMSANYEVLRGQLGVNNPQLEFSEMSLRTEQMRILPKGFQVTSSDDQNNASSLEFNNISSGAEAQWQAALTEGRVADLWDVREYRNYCRPFAPRYDASGTAIKEPGIVLRFGTEVTPGKNFFGRPLAGGDHTYDPSNYSTKIRAAAITFDDYLSDNVLNDLSDSPRVYLIPVGSDVISYPVTNPSDNSAAGLKRFWDVVDQKIPLPFPATSSTLDRVDYNPIIDNINDRFGNPRRFSSFRVKHSTTGSVDDVTEDSIVEDSRLVGRSVANTKWVLIIPGRALYHDGDVGLDRFIRSVSDIKLYLDTYGFSGG